MISYVRSQLSCVLTEPEAVAIANQTHLFGYRPRMMRLLTGARLTLHSNKEAQTVRDLRDEMRRHT